MSLYSEKTEPEAERADSFIMDLAIRRRIIHNEKQERAINPDYIDGIKKENGIRF